MTIDSYQKLTLLPHPQDQKQWIAEITDKDETYRLKRQFLPLEDDHYRIYDGWYQIHGNFLGAETPFTKEYCYIQKGQMKRNIPYRQIISDLPRIIEFESTRIEQLKDYITDQLDDIYKQVPYEFVQEAILEQKDQLSLIHTSQELYQALHQLLRQKSRIIKQYETAAIKWQQYNQEV